MLCSRRGMHPMDCRIACDLSAVQYHRIYRKLSGDMLGACASAMMVSDCPHGQVKRIIQRKLSPKMPPHGAFQPNPIVEATVKKTFPGSLCGRSTDQLSIKGAPPVGAQRPGRRAAPAQPPWAAGGPRHQGRPAKSAAVKNRQVLNAMTEMTE